MSEHAAPSYPIKLPAPRLAMKAPRSLTRKQAAFVQAYVDTGDQTQAALLAGFKPERARITGCELIRHSAVNAEIRKELQARLETAAPIAFKALIDLVKDAESENVKLQASVALLDRGGFSVIRKIESHSVIDIRSDSELTEAAKALIERLKELNLHGADAKPMIDVTPGATETEAAPSESMAYDPSNDESEAE